MHSVEYCVCMNILVLRLRDPRFHCTCKNVQKIFVKNVKNVKNVSFTSVGPTGTCLTPVLVEELYGSQLAVIS